jgi:hypothetical protein
MTTDGVAAEIKFMTTKFRDKCDFMGERNGVEVDLNGGHNRNRWLNGAAGATIRGMFESEHPYVFRTAITYTKLTENVWGVVTV